MLLIVPPRSSNDSERSFSEDVATWTGQFALNLLVPAPIALAINDRHGRLGVLLAFVFAWFIGAMICSSRSMAELLCRGASRVAWTQLVPVLQLGSALLGVLAVCLMQFDNRSIVGMRFSSDEVRAFVSTFVALIPLAVVGFLIGGGLRYRLEGPNDSEAADYRDSKEE